METNQKEKHQMSKAKEFLVCIKDGKKRHAFTFPTKKSQIDFVRDIKRKFPGTELIYTVD